MADTSKTAQDILGEVTRASEEMSKASLDATSTFTTYLNGEAEQLSVSMKSMTLIQIYFYLLLLLMIYIPVFCEASDVKFQIRFLRLIIVCPYFRSL